MASLIYSSLHLYSYTDVFTGRVSSSSCNLLVEVNLDCVVRGSSSVVSPAEVIFFESEMFRKSWASAGRNYQVLSTYGRRFLFHMIC